MGKITMGKLLFTFLALVVCCVYGELKSALPADRFALANQLVKRGLYAEAEAEYEALKTSNAIAPDELLFRRAELRRLTKHDDEARTLYAELMQSHPKSRYYDFATLDFALLSTGTSRTQTLIKLDRNDTEPQVRATTLYYLGDEAEKRGDLSQAADYFRRAAAVNDSAMAKHAKLRSASLLAQSNKPIERRMALATYLDLATSNDATLAEDSLFFAGMMSYRDKHYKEAATLYRRLISRWPNGKRSKDALTFAAWACYLDNKPNEALELVRQAGNTEDALYLTACCLKKLEQREEAIAAYTTFLKAFPQSQHAQTAWYDRLTLRATSRQWNDVLNDVKVAGDLPDKMAASAWLYGCEAAISLTNFPNALSFARRIIALRDEGGTHAQHQSRALYLSGVIESRMNQPREACADWTQLLAKYPDAVEARDALLMRAMEEIKLKEFRAANRSLQDFARHWPNEAGTPNTLYWRGLAARGADDAPEAEKLFLMALTKNPSADFSREIKLELAFLLQKRGDAQGSTKYFSEILSTKAVDRLPPAQLAWIAETMLANTNATALTVAQLLTKRNVDDTWNQIAATLTGRAHELKHERDAAKSAYTRALDNYNARTDAAAQAALALGKLELADGNFEAATKRLSDAVERAHTKELAKIRVEAYVALAQTEEARNNSAGALGYWMMVGTLYDDAQLTPNALKKAAAILRTQGKAKEADALDAECSRRYPKEGK